MTIKMTYEKRIYVDIDRNPINKNFILDNKVITFDN